VSTVTPPAVDARDGALHAQAPKRTRRSKNSGEEGLRYFLGKPSGSTGKPELGDETPDEHQALIKAFQKDGVIYVIQTFRVDAEVQDGRPILIKRPLLKKQD